MASPLIATDRGEARNATTSATSSLSMMRPSALPAPMRRSISAASTPASRARAATTSGVRSVRVSDAELTLVLCTGLEIRLGDPGDLRLKLTIARRVLAASHADARTAGYLDVSVPERPVIAAKNPQL